MTYAESARVLTLREGIDMAHTVLSKGQIGLLEAMKDSPSTNLFFRWPPALSGVLRLSESMFVIADPKDVKPILIGQHENIEKGTRDFRIIRQFLGQALVPNLGGDAWYARRKLLTPTFSHSRVIQFGEAISEETEETLDRVLDTGEPFGLKDEMTRLTLRVINKFLFSEDISPRLQDEISCHITTLAEYTSRRIQYLGFPPKWFPGETNRNFKRAISGMRAILGEIYERHIAAREAAPDDMLKVLINAKDEATGKPLTKSQVMDECLSMLIAGHETTANTLTWAMYLVAKHPGIQDEIQNEISSIVGNNDITVDDLRKLSKVGWALKEAMRLYPPVWVFSRKNSQAFTMPSGQVVPKKTFIAFVPWLIHRNPNYWKDPDKFNPQRFDPKNPDPGVADAYLPFGMGQRRCIGADLAFTEASIVLGKVLQKARIEINEDVNPALLITTRPNSPVMTTLVSRN